MKKYKYNDVLAYDEEGKEAGHIPEDLDIWVPPKSLFIPSIDKLIDTVSLEGKDENAELIFYVPKNWVLNNTVGGVTKLYNMGWTKKKDASKLLQQFISLADKKSDQFLVFAKRWGPLWEQTNPQVLSNIIPQKCSVAPWIESVGVWRDYSLIVRSFLDIAAFLFQDESAPSEKWHYLLKLGSDGPDSLKAPDSLNDQRMLFSFYFNMHVYDEYDIRYSLNWSNKTPKIRLHSKKGFISSVWFQLLQAITQQTICLCDGCGSTYVRTGRRPKIGTNNYCNNCRGTKNRHNAAAKRAYYHRNKDNNQRQGN